MPKPLHGQRQLPVERQRAHDDNALKPYIFVWIQDVPYSLHELGDIANMTLPDMMAALFERGYFGKYPEGHTWWDHIDPDCFKAMGHSRDNLVSREHRERFHRYVRYCQELCAMNAFTEQHRANLMRMHQQSRMIEKMISA